MSTSESSVALSASQFLSRTSCQVTTSGQTLQRVPCGFVKLNTIQMLNFMRPLCRVHLEYQSMCSDPTPNACPCLNPSASPIEFDSEISIVFDASNTVTRDPSETTLGDSDRVGRQDGEVP
ncbi:hypothetical protein BKA70DRAFT_1242327 [Coprinopsis sp. MPI-PUGE-AT-0042]|nr:hypothetical protein BKA70DRAFT_1242327 [Coprinopsis sp. MPI-PUGE-AT-0042]